MDYRDILQVLEDYDNLLVTDEELENLLKGVDLATIIDLGL